MVEPHCGVELLLVWKQMFARTRVVFTHPIEWLSPFLNPLRILVDEFVCLQVIFWNLLAFPPLHEILGKQCVQTMVLLNVPEYMLRPSLDILSRMIMLYPNMISLGACPTLRDLSHDPRC